MIVKVFEQLSIALNKPQYLVKPSLALIKVN